MHGSQSHPVTPPLTAAEALKEEFIQLHGPLPGYHAWLNQLPAEPRLWLLRKDHFKNPRPLVEDLLAATTPLTRFLRERLSAETARTLEACQRSPLICDSFLESLADDLNRAIVGGPVLRSSPLGQADPPSTAAERGQPLYDKERFASVKLTPETEALVRSAPTGQRLEILNRLLLEEAFPASIAKMWDTLGGVYALLHTRGRTALCLSGGGIRSATFGLGVLQGLARRDLLGEFDYLSTVSGGGYIGSWLSSWIHHAGSSQKVFESLKNQSIPSPAEPEPKPLEHLRRFSNYLTPKLGSLSADTWTLVGTYLRNLTLNWIVFLPVIIAVLVVPRLGVALLRLPAEPWALTALMAAGVVLGAIGIAYGAVQRPMLAGRLRERSRFWASRGDQMSFLLYCFLPLWLAAVCFTTFWAWLPGITFELPPWWCFAVAGAFLHLCGWLLSVVVLRRAGIAEVAAVLLTGAVGGLMLWLPARAAFTNLLDAPDLELYVCFAVPVFLFVFLLTATLFIGLASRRTGDADREWWARMGAWLLLGILAWSAFSSLVLFGPLGLLALPLLWNLAGGLPGLFIVLAGYSNTTPPNKEESAQTDWKGRLMNWGMALAAPLFIVFAIALLSLGTSALFLLWPDLKGLAHLALVHETPVWLAAALILGAGLFGLLMSRLISINKFSLHSVYRNRLIRAYLGASNPKRDPNPFTGFDPKDNIRLSQLAGQRPLHVVNMALNLVSDDNLAWQQRKAETFTASSLHIGNYRLGYRRARDYAQNEKQQGLSLGTAITISGAAASPNQGYHSSPTIAVLMTLFNVRLGAWLGNPGLAGNAVFHKSSPGNAALHVAKEAFGLTDNDSPYVYLSDGGHFENLGLYEMVLRRCHLIVVSDAGCDADCCLEDLGNAIRKIRVDLGVPIDMTRFDIHARKAGAAGRHCAIGEIHYDKMDGPNARRGLLLYIKPAITGDEPRDVFNYAQTSPEFPHESTGDQWFSESQFESYRMLGLHTVIEMCQDWERTHEYYNQVPTLAVFARQTYKYLEIPYPPGLEHRLYPREGKDEPAAPERATTTEAPATAPAPGESSGELPKSF